MNPKTTIARALWAAAMLAAAATAARAEAPKNLFANPSFEMGRQGWRMDKDRGTVASFKVERGGAAAGQYAMLVTVEKVVGWGVQFGQSLDAGPKGKTYTFAVLARAVGSPVTVDLQIERRAKPHDRAARTGKVKLSPDKWTELHVTFRVAKDYPQGWFAYVSCYKPTRFRVDMFRLTEGPYVPYAEAAEEHVAAAGMKLFDTGGASAGPIAGEAMGKRTGWVQVPAGTTAHAFKGDAAFLNDKLAVVVRRRGESAELYAAEAGTWRRRAGLAPVGKSSAAAGALASLKIAANDAGAVAADAVFGTGAKSAAVRIRLAMGLPYVETQAASPPAAALRVEAPCRFAVMPDFFADDMVLDAAELPGERTELPADHFLLHLPADRNAIVMTVRNVVDGDVPVALSGEGEQRAIASALVPYGKDGRVWVAVLTGGGIWHRHDVAAKDVLRIIPLDWKAPWPALWRVDWRKDGGLSDSWEMIRQRPDGRFAKYAWFGPAGVLPTNRKRWATVLGSFLYPCWQDRDGRGYLQPLKRGLRFEGPALIYPINRVPATPLDRFTVVDVVRATLGVGPCEYILDLEGQKSRNRGRATCSVRDTLKPIYAKGRQRQQRAKIERTLEEVMVFIRYIRSRIEQYVAFGHGIREYLAAQKKAHAELAKPIDELDAAARRIDAYFDARRATIKTPDDAAKLVAEFRRTMLDYEGPDALKRCKRFTSAWVRIGGSQDELVGECRLAVKVLRQRASLLAARRPEMAPIAREIRSRSQKVLRNPAGHEGANH